MKIFFKQCSAEQFIFLHEGSSDDDPVHDMPYGCEGLSGTVSCQTQQLSTRLETRAESSVMYSEAAPTVDACP